MPNKELLKATLQHIKDNQEGWKQSTWRSVPGLEHGKPKILPTICGTAMCFAGEAVTIEKSKSWLITLDDVKAAAKLGEYATMARMDNMLSMVVVRPATEGETAKISADDFFYGLVKHPLSGQMFHVEQASEAAQELLGLSSEQARILFQADNELGDLEAIVTLLIEEEDPDLTGFDSDLTDEGDYTDE